MKSLFLAMMICIGTVVFANDDMTIFRDEDTGLAMEIPNEIKYTWNISNFEEGFEVAIFNSELNDEGMSIVAIIKMPLEQSPLLKMEELYDSLIDKLWQVLSQEEVFHVFPANSLAPQEYFSQRFHIQFEKEEDEDSCESDIHLFLQNDYICGIVTGQLHCVSKNLENLTQSILKTVRFIQE